MFEEQTVNGNGGGRQETSPLDELFDYAGFRIATHLERGNTFNEAWATVPVKRRLDFVELDKNGFELFGNRRQLFYDVFVFHF
jgi:hypothetical protein